MPSLTYRMCTTCGKELPATTEFFYASKTGKYGLCAKCKVCSSEYSKQYNAEHRDKKQVYQQEYYEKNKDRMKQKSLEWFQKHPEKRRKYKLKHRFNLTEEEYEAMVNSQNGVCAICGQKEESLMRSPNGQEFISPLCVDHDHDTNKVRGLLCHKCNKALGAFNCVELLQLAIDYLRKGPN